MLPTSPPSPIAAASGLDWGSVADWLAGLATLSAVLVSIWLAQRDGKRLEVERREAAEDRAEFRRLQAEEAEQGKRRLASQVTLYSESGYDSAGKQVSRTYHVHNGGDEPITMVKVVERPTVGDTLSTVGHTVEWWDTIEAGGRRMEVLKYVPGEAILQVHPANRSLIFSDGAKRRWERKELGGLSRFKEDDPDAPELHLSSE